MHIDFNAFLMSLRIMIEGWLGIFLVMGLIIAVIYGLNHVTNKMEARSAEEQEKP